MTIPEPLAPNLGVRERKRRAVMDHIQEAALDLFDARGYERVTIEDVAAEAGVSPSTVYRHFGTKQRLVTYDEIDRTLVNLLLGHYPALSPTQAARAVLQEVAPILEREGLRIARRVRYMIDEPSVYAALSVELRDTSDFVARGLLERAGDALDPLSADVIAHTLCDTLVVAVRIWRESDFRMDFATIMGRCLDLLDSGLATPEA